MTDLETFRTETRAWLEANCPAEMRQPAKGDDDICWGGRNWVFSSPAQKQWLEVMAAKGWTVPDWPEAYGGGGLSPEETKALRQEMAKLGCRSPLNSFGIWMLGPALLKFGTEEQKKHYLPQIARGEIRWCQGYSEPGSGSDLVSLQTFGEDKGDHWVVNGQKIWTSYADKADWIFCLVRTNKEDKYNGISFLLFDMTTPGVSTKPILLISGASPFCETFFDNVVVPKHQIVGEVLEDNPVLRAEMAMFEVENLAYRAHSERFMDEWKTGRAHPAYSNLMKYVGTELNKKRHEIIMAAGGSDALEWESARTNGGARPRAWLRTKANSIEGGTSEVMLNVVSKRILEMPGA
jgi:alkylation response protein AidB-like acyl-CoA dehydrogenase